MAARPVPSHSRDRSSTVLVMGAAQAAVLTPHKRQVAKGVEVAVAVAGLAAQAAEAVAAVVEEASATTHLSL